MGIAGKNQTLFSWGRYLYWADLMQRDWDKFMTERGDEAMDAIPEWLCVSCYWGASLYVVIEGWEAANFTDPIIDALLGLSDYKDVLRRLRNGTFHFQPELISPKVTAFFKSPNTTLWLFFLHDEFCRWLRDWVDAVELVGRFLPEESEEWRANFATLIGWLPLRMAEAELKEAKKHVDEYERQLDASGSTSKAAQELRESFGLYDDAVKKTAEGIRNYRRDRLAELGFNPDDFIP
jgi:hypothetical protein